MIKINHLNITFNKPLFQNQDISIKNNSLTLIVGKSGCGKTTLLYKLGLMNVENTDDIRIDDRKISELSTKKKTLFRRYNIAYVFQDYILYDHFNVFENMQYCAALAGYELTQKEAAEYLLKVYLDISLDRMPCTLSSGQKQRLAIACALTKKAPLLILDEPTSALDENNVNMIFKILSELKNERTIIVTSHNQIAYHYCDEILEIKDGKITKIKESQTVERKINLIKKGAHLPLHIYRNYIKKQYLYNKKIKKLMILANFMILVFSLGLTQIINLQVQKSESLISLENNGYMYVQTSHTTDFENEPITKFYPFYDISLFLLGNVYPVVPLYEELDINDHVWTRFDYSKHKGIYLSHSMYYENKHILIPSEQIEFYDMGVQENIKFLYKGILLKGYGTVYTDSKEYILMNNNLIESQFKNKEIKGYTLLCQSFNDFVSTMTSLEEKGFQVIPFEGFYEIQEYVQQLKK